MDELLKWVIPEYPSIWSYPSCGWTKIICLSIWTLSKISQHVYQWWSVASWKHSKLSSRRFLAMLEEIQFCKLSSLHIDLSLLDLRVLYCKRKKRNPKTTLLSGVRGSSFIITRLYTFVKKERLSIFVLVHNICPRYLRRYFASGLHSDWTCDLQSK